MVALLTLVLCATTSLLWLMELLAGAVIATALACLAIVHGLTGFVQLGGRRLSAGGVFLLGMVLFGYFPTLWYRLTTPEVPSAFEVPGLAAMLALQVLWVSFWQTAPALNSDSRHPTPDLPRGVPALSLGVAGIYFGLGVGIFVLDIQALRHLAQPFGYASVTVAGLVLVQRRAHFRFRSLVGLALLFAAFAAFFFTGGGRLVLGSLAVALALVAGTRWTPAYLKPTMVLSLPPALWLLATDRSARTEQFLHGYRETGLESVVWPQRVFFQMLESVTYHDFPLGGGSTFAAASVIWVPREVWPDKPVGFGTVLTALYKPHLLAVGHSEAALVHGEFVYNFGWMGLIVLAVVVAGLVTVYERMLRTTYLRAPDGLDDLAVQAIVITLVAGLLDLVWVGTFTYASRAGFTCILLLLLYVLGRIARSLRRPRTGDVPASHPPAAPRAARQGPHESPSSPSKERAWA